MEKKKRKYKWTQDEVRILKEHYNDNIDLLRKALPRRTSACIYGKARRLGLKRYDKLQSQVKILLQPDAVIPTKGHDNDFAYDCVAIGCEELAPHIYRYRLGISLQKVATLPSKRAGFRIAPRSSIWKTGMVLTNSEGIVDEGYTGEISAVFYHIRPEMPRYQVGDKVCQLYMQHSSDIKFVKVRSLLETERGNGREGSTGK